MPASRSSLLSMARRLLQHVREQVGELVGLDPVLAGEATQVEQPRLGSSKLGRGKGEFGAGLADLLSASPASASARSSASSACARSG
jgi:hypothetical protein